MIFSLKKCQFCSIYIITATKKSFKPHHLPPSHDDVPSRAVRRAEPCDVPLIAKSSDKIKISCYNIGVIEREGEKIMYKNEIKNEKIEIYNAIKNIDEQETKIKIALHTLEKLGCDTSELYKQLDNLGISIHKMKTDFLDRLKNL